MEETRDKVFSSAAGMTRDASVASGKTIKLLGLVSQTINAKPELVFRVRVPDEATVIGAAGVGVTGEMIAQVGTISANRDATIGNIIAEAMKNIGGMAICTKSKQLFHKRPQVRVAFCVGASKLQERVN